MRKRRIVTAVVYSLSLKKAFTQEIRRNAKQDNRNLHFARRTNLEEGVMSQFFDFAPYFLQHLPEKAVHHGYISIAQSMGA